jgi:ent-kaurene oxidase
MEVLLWESILLNANTTMVIIEWIMFELARNPTIQECLYKEVINVIGGEN